MNKIDFCKCAKALLKYSNWESQLYGCGINLEGTPANDLADIIHTLMCDGNPAWAYDTKLGLDWIIEWCFGDDNFILSQTRYGVEFDLSDAGALYDFLVFMNKHGWED